MVSLGPKWSTSCHLCFFPGQFMGFCSDIASGVMNIHEPFAYCHVLWDHHHVLQSQPSVEYSSWGLYSCIVILWSLKWGLFLSLYSESWLVWFSSLAFLICFLIALCLIFCLDLEFCSTEMSLLLLYLLRNLNQLSSSVLRDLSIQTWIQHKLTWSS